MNEIVLEVSDLTTHLQIGKRLAMVVDHVNFVLRKGKTLAIVGESGCGKTMTALSILRILPAPPPPKGKVLFSGKDLIEMPESELRTLRGSRIAMIFQDPSTALNPVYTIGNQLEEVVYLHNDADEGEAKQKVLQTLSEVGIPFPHERYDEFPHQLSGGLKQRVMIAMALICQPDILIADEPTTALDVTIQAQVLELIRDLQRKREMSLLLITHDMGVVAEMADDVLVMYASQIVESGSANDIFYKKAHPYTKGLFDSRSTSESRRGKLTPIKGTVPSLGDYPPGCHFHPRCPYAMEKCKKGAVPEFHVEGDSAHLSRCWLHDGTEESAQRLIQIGKL